MPNPSEGLLICCKKAGVMPRLSYDGILLVSDMDRTLLDSCSRLSRENRLALERFVNKGGSFTIATGRMVEAVRPYLMELPITVPAILYNGAMIYDFKSDKVVWQLCLEDEINATVKNVLETFPETGIEVFSQGQVYVASDNIEAQKHALREGFKPIRADLDEIPMPWVKVILADRHEQLININSFLSPRPGKFRRVFSEPQFLELVHSEVSKGAAMRRLSESLGSYCNYTISMGDNMNDIELIAMADIGIAVENANPELKKLAKYCCCHHDSHSAAEVINWIENGIIKL